MLGAGDYNAEELRAGIVNALNRIACIEAVQQADAGIDPPGASPKPKIDKVCETCHGDVTFEGYISWDVESQEFVVDGICDKGHLCDKCNGTTYAIDIAYKPLALVVRFIETDNERTYRFETQAELTSFREGLETGDHNKEFEITYTDEESDDEN